MPSVSVLCSPSLAGMRKEGDRWMGSSRDSAVGQMGDEEREVVVLVGFLFVCLFLFCFLIDYSLSFPKQETLDCMPLGSY